MNLLKKINNNLLIPRLKFPTEMEFEPIQYVMRYASLALIHFCKKTKIIGVKKWAGII